MHYPKTSMAKALACDPRGFKTVQQSMSWATVFLKRLCAAYGRDYVAKKVSAWSWATTTCFSGIGCAEMARSSGLFAFMLEMPRNKSHQNAFPQALLSIQAAVNKMFPECRPRGIKNHVDMIWAVEKEKGCQKILKDTYSVCCFGDILKLDHTEKTLWCTTHNMYCPVSVQKNDGRSLAMHARRLHLIV